MHRQNKHTILLFAEDPGAVNFIAPIFFELSFLGFPSFIISSGTATEYLESLGIKATVVSDNTDADEIINKINPDLYITGTSENRNSLGLLLIDSCRKANIISIGVVDAFMNAQLRFCGTGNDPLRYVSDYLFLPDDITKDEYKNIGFPEDKSFVCGHPNYDYVRQKAIELDKKNRINMRRKLFPLAEEESKIIAFAAEISDGLDSDYFKYSKDYSLKGRGHTKNRTNIVIEEFLDAVKSFSSDLFIVLRLHPKNNNEEFSDYYKEFDQISIKESAYEIIFFSDYVIGMTSMLMTEALIMGKPTFSILVKESEKNWLSNLRSGLTPYASDRETLIKALPEFLNKKQAMSSDFNAILSFDSIKKIIKQIKNILD
ncbi:MAG: hypothetical protein KAI40_00255 [Desulfobacterales bacterium]|nr:hypothetical protein [Desulfobacterales bacterium]